MEGDRTGTVAEGVVSVVYGSGSRKITSEVENPVIGSQTWKSGGRKGAVNLKCPDAGRRIQHADQDELAAGRRLNDFVVDVDDGAFQNKGDPLFLSQRDGNPRNRFSAGRAESDGKSCGTCPQNSRTKPRLPSETRNSTFFGSHFRIRSHNNGERRFPRCRWRRPE